MGLKMYNKKQAGYKDNAKTKKCENCKHYRHKSCVLVVGIISPKGTCRYWRKEK